MRDSLVAQAAPADSDRLGDKDPIIPVNNARIMARLIPNSTLHVVDSGHAAL